MVSRRNISLMRDIIQLLRYVILSNCVPYIATYETLANTSFLCGALYDRGTMFASAQLYPPTEDYVAQHCPGRPSLRPEAAE